jgi:hypothetical protein
MIRYYGFNNAVCFRQVHQEPTSAIEKSIMVTDDVKKGRQQAGEGGVGQ